MTTDMKKEMWEAMASSPNVMVSLVGKYQHAEPMRAQLDKHANGEFWFYTRKDNRIAEGGEAMVHFSSKGRDVFACIRGVLVRELRPEIIDKYWSNPVEAWYDEGKNDPNLRMLRFELVDAEIWHADPSLKGMFKMMTGKTLNGDEMGEHDKVSL